MKRLLRRSKNAKVYGIDISEESVAKAKKVCANVLDKQVFVCQGSAEKLAYEEGKFDLVTAVETVYFWPNLPGCLQEVRRVLKRGGKFAIMVEVVDSNSMWTNVVEGMTVYSPEELKKMLDDAGFIQTEIYRKKPSYATIIGVRTSLARVFMMMPSRRASGGAAYISNCCGVVSMTTRLLGRCWVGFLMISRAVCLMCLRERQFSQRRNISD